MKAQTKKLPAGVSQQFVDSLDNTTTVELKAMIVNLQLDNEINEQYKESVEFLQAKEEYDHAVDRFKLVAAPVKDITTSIKNKTKLIIERLKEKGGA